jgi:hypothetical protein
MKLREAAKRSELAAPHGLAPQLIAVGRLPVIGSLGFDSYRLTILTSVTFSSWVCDSPSRLARFPYKLDSMPVYGGNSVDIGRVRTELLCQF